MVSWDAFKIPVNIVSVVDNVDIKALPMYVSTRDGPGFMVNNRVFNVYRDLAKEEMEEETIGVGKRLLFHWVVNGGGLRQVGP